MNKLIGVGILIVIIAGALLVFSTPTQETQDTNNPEIRPESFSTNITNPYFTLIPGTKWVYEAKKEDGIEHIEFYVTHDKKTVMGVETVVVWDRVWLDGDLIEDTKDWFAQDDKGNVWYFGEETYELVNGKVVSTHGAWEAGVDGAKPGIIMPANPTVGLTYREEYYQGEAEDEAEVLSLSESVSVPYGSFSGCLKTKNYTQLEPSIVEHKTYCKEAGNTVLEVDVDGGERVELVSLEHNAEPTPSDAPIKSTDTKKATPSPAPAITPPPPTTVTTPSGEREMLQTKITEEQAKTIALSRVPGTVTDVSIEEKYGKTAYVVEIKANGGAETDVIIDVATGEVLGVEE